MTAADLIVHLPRSGASRVAWEMIERETGALLHSGDLGETSPFGGTIARVLYIAPASDILMRRVLLPTRHEGEARQAAPFALEEDIASDLAEAHVAIGPRDATGRRLTFAVSAELAERWAAIAARIAVRPAYLVPDAWHLSAEEGDLVLAGDRGDILFFNRGDTGPACGRIEAALADDVLPALIAAARPTRLAMTPELRLPSGPGLTLPDDILGIRFSDPVQAIRGLDEAALRALPELLGRSHSARPDWGSLARPFRRAAILASAAFILFCVLAGGEGVYLRSQADLIDAQAEADFRAAFPEVTRVVDVEAQLRQRLQGHSPQSSSDFLRLSGALSAAVAQGGQLRIESLRYDETGASLGVSAVYPDFASFEAFSRNARAMGLAVEDGGARQTGPVLAGEFTVSFP